MSEFVLVKRELLERCIKANDEPQPSQLYADLRAVLAQEAGHVEVVSDEDLLSMADKAFGQVVDYDLHGGPITDYRILIIGAYGPAIRRLVSLARQYPASPPAPVSVDERTEFESWVRREWPQAPLSNVRDLLPYHDPRYGEYCDESLQRAWVGWQARASLDKLKELNQ